MKAYFYPSCPREGYVNPYCINFKKAIDANFELLDADNKVTKMKTLTLLWYSFAADVVFFNWIETVAKLRLGFIQYIFAYISFFLLKVRKCKIVWIYHNIQPHCGRDWCSDRITNYLFRNADLIITHSKEAKRYVIQHTERPVEFICHPINELRYNPLTKDNINYDVVIWGTILPYKGVAEFLENCTNNLSTIRILIIGKCKDIELVNRIQQKTNNNVKFRNCHANFDELAAVIKKSKFVLFPYIGNSISSSGVLMDTLLMGGIPVGPQKGAFIDLQEEGVCLCYKDYDDLTRILQSNITLDKQKIGIFIKRNTWHAFGKKIKELLL